MWRSLSSLDLSAAAATYSSCSLSVWHTPSVSEWSCWRSRSVAVSCSDSASIASAMAASSPCLSFVQSASTRANSASTAARDATASAARPVASDPFAVCSVRAEVISLLIDSKVICATAAFRSLSPCRSLASVRWSSFTSSFLRRLDTSCLVSRSVACMSDLSF